MLQLMLFCRREGKWDEVPSVDLFFALRDHLERSRECKLIQRDALVLTLGKDNQKLSQLHRSARSIGKWRVKYGGPGEEEAGTLVAPPGKDRRNEREEEEVSDEGESFAGSEEFSPIAGRTRGGSGGQVAQALP